LLQRLHSFQLCAQFHGTLVAIGGPLLQRLQDQRLEQRRKICIQLPGRGRRFVQDGSNQLRGVGRGKRRFSRGHFEQHSPCGVQIASNIIRFPAQLFRRHVWQGAGENVFMIVLSFYSALENPRLGNREPKVKNFQAPFRSEDQISWFQVAVENSLFMCSFQACCQHDAEPQNFSFG
jgi:hypothetical protein